MCSVIFSCSIDLPTVRTSICQYRPVHNAMFQCFGSNFSDNDEHHLAPLSRFCNSGAIYKYHDLLTYLLNRSDCTSVTVPLSSAAERRTANSTRCPSFLIPSIIIPACVAAAAICHHTCSLAEHLLYHTNICLIC